MKISANYLLLFDEDCVLCAWSAKVAMATGIIGEENKTPYQEFPYAACPIVDRQKAANEIALVNKETGEVTYGVKSLFKVLSIIAPKLEPVLSLKPFIWLMTRLYRLFALNRRIIFPPVHFATKQPNFSLAYRFAYIFLTWLITSLILTHYVLLISPVVPVGAAYREYLVCGGQIAFQGVVVSIIAKDKQWDYLGNMMTISFGGALALLPATLLSTVIGSYPVLFVLYFMMVAGLMFLEHMRRTKILSLGWVPTITWALYRLIILVIILFLA